MSPNNKMGGFVAAKIIAADQVSNFYIKDRQVHLNASLQSYIDLDAVKNGIDVSINPITDSHGLVYEVTANVILKGDIDIDITPFNRTLLFAKTATGQMWIFGSPQFPLHISYAPSFSSTPSGRNSIVLNITGKSPFAPAMLAR